MSKHGLTGYSDIDCAGQLEPEDRPRALNPCIVQLLFAGEEAVKVCCPIYCRELRAKIICIRNGVQQS